jgi:ubiquitin C-terminal hydrolase
LSLALKKLFYFSREENFVSIEEKLVLSFARLVTLIESGVFTVIKPVRFFFDLCQVVPMYAKKGQQDTQEFIRILLDTTQSVLKEGCVEACFKGEFATKIACGRCDYESTVIETFLDLSLQIPEHNVEHTYPLSRQDQRVIDRVDNSWDNLL